MTTPHPPPSLHPERGTDAAEHSPVDAVRRRLIVPGVHRIRGALSNIQGYSELLLATDYPPADRRELLATIHQQSRDIESFLMELLELFLCESGGGRDLEIAAHDLATLVRAEAQQCAAPGAISLQAGEDLPPVAVDALRLGEVLRELLLHGVSQALQGGGPRVLIDRAPAPGFLQMLVEEPGRHLDSDQLSRLFEPFFRVDPGDPGARAALGLAWVKAIVELHGGTVAASPGPAGGHRITVYLPIANGFC